MGTVGWGRTLETGGVRAWHTLGHWRGEGLAHTWALAGRGLGTHMGTVWWGHTLGTGGVRAWHTLGHCGVEAHTWALAGQGLALTKM